MSPQIKKIIKKWLAGIAYGLYRHQVLPSRIRVNSVEETLNVLLTTEKSMVRFGDGEIVVINGRNIPTQAGNEEIAEGLKRILGFHHENLIVTLPDIFGDLNIYVPASQDFWKDHLLFFRHVYQKFCDLDKAYYNTSVTRGYITYADKSGSGNIFRRFREVWKDRKIVVVEGCTTHNGVGNDLLDQAKEVKRIICPSRNAYRVLERILKECLRYEKDILFLLSVGITAKFLAEELFLKGYRVLDIGNLDMEYEWYLCGAVTKEPILKHQVIGEQANREAGYDQYLKEIVCYIE